MQENNTQEQSRLDRFINHPSTQALIGLVVIIIFMSLAWTAGVREGRHAGLVDCGQELNDIDQLRKDLSESVKPPAAAPQRDQGAQR